MMINSRLRKKLAVLVTLTLGFQGILGFGTGDGSKDAEDTAVLMPQVITAYAEETGTSSPTPSVTPPTGAGGTASPTPSTATPSPGASPAPTPTEAPWWGEGAQPTFFMVVNSQGIANGKLIDMTTETLTLGIGNSAGVFPSDAIIRWESYNKKVIQIVEDSGGINSGGTQYTVTLRAVGPGYTSLGAVVSYGGRDYPVNCQVHVPLQLKRTTGDINNNNGTGKLGMIDSLRAGETSEAKVIQLKLDDPVYSHYLPLFEYVNYADSASGTAITSIVSNTEFNNGILIPQGQIPAWEWTTSNSNVAVVDQYGYITAVGAGYAEITVTTLTTADNSKKDSKTIGILVVPSVQLPGSAEFKTGRVNYTATATSMTIYTNAVLANELTWTLYRGTADRLSSAEALDIDNNRYMKVNISDFGNGVTLSEMKAGVYCLIARPSDGYAENNASVRKVILQIIVPVMISENPIVMNVGDIYDVLQSANIPVSNLFTYTVENVTVADISDGIVTGYAEGSTYIKLHYRGGAYDIFDGMTTDENGMIIVKDDYRIPLTVIDGIALNMTSATIYTDATLQLHLNTSNNSAPIVWTSSDPTVATVDENGLVKGLKEGTTTITVTQTIHGVTKKATCIIRVEGSVTSITLDPTQKTLAIGDLLTINAKVTPKLNQVTLHWVSSDTSVISIEQSGDLSATVKAVAGGTAVVTAINQKNVVVGSCLITVKQPITGITLSQTNVTIPLSAKKFMLYATLSPEGARNEEVIWKSTDTSVITVDEHGAVTLKKAGSAAIICSAKDDGNISAICNVIVTKAVTGIKLDQTSLNMYVGEAYRLTYLITPTDASDVAVTWMSTNTSVATVDAKGLVSAKSVGQTVIILKSTDGGYMSTCIINVERVATAVKLDVNALTLNTGDYYYFETTITPADSTETTLVWETSDKSVAVISNKGKVTAKKAGVAVILAKTKSGSTAYCTVTVQQGVTSVELDVHELTMVEEETAELTAKVSPKNATVADVEWTSSNNSVAKVDDRGRVTALKPGVTIITCTSVDGGYVDYCAVIVEAKEVEVSEIRVIPETYRLGVGKTYKLTAEILPAEATNQELKWTSSNTKVVTVDKNGKIRGISVGEAVITCAATDGSGTEAYCEVEVCYQISDIGLNYDYLELVVGHSETLKATLSPANATYGVTWESADTSIAVVNQNGRVTARKAGDTTITAKAQDNSGMVTTCYVHVINPVPISNIQVSESEIVMTPGEEKTVSFSILPAGYTDTYEWSSDNPVVASVNSRTGLITAKSMGTANITIFASSGRSASIKVYVVGLSKSTLSLQQYSSTIISLDVYGADRSKMTIKWYSDNERIAEVANGKITARAIGTTTVYAVVNGRKLPCKVTVEKIRN